MFKTGISQRQKCPKKLNLHVEVASGGEGDGGGESGSGGEGDGGGEAGDLKHGDSMQCSRAFWIAVNASTRTTTLDSSVAISSRIAPFWTLIRYSLSPIKRSQSGELPPVF